MKTSDYILSLAQGAAASGHLARVASYVQHREEGIASQLEAQRLTLGQQQLIAPKPPPTEPVDQEVVDPKYLQLRKQQAKQLLKDLQRQEIALKRQMALNNSQTQSVRERSIMNEEDIESLKGLLSKQRKLQRQLKRKDQQIAEETTRLKQYALEQDEDLKNQQRSLRKEAAEERLRQLQLKQNKRQEEYQATQKRLQELRRDNYLYDRLEKVLEEELKHERAKKLDELKQAFHDNHVGLEEINRHAQFYNQTINKKREQRQERLAEWRSNSEYIRPPANRYSQLTKKEREQAQQQRLLKLQSPVKSKQLLANYSTEVREKNKSVSPKKPQPEAINTTKVSLPEIKPLQRTELLKIGGDYLEKAKLARKRTVSMSSIPTETTTTQQYTHYLRDSLPRYNLDKDQREIEKVRNLLERQQKDLLGVSKALEVANRLEISAGWNSSRLANSIQAKLLILSKLK